MRRAAKANWDSDRVATVPNIAPATGGGLFNGIRQTNPRSHAGLIVIQLPA